MQTASNIMIIGAGLIGLSTADYLTARGAKVTIIEARPGPARGTSYANSGMVHPSQSRPWGLEAGAANDVAFKAVYDLALRSKVQVQERLGELGLLRDRPVPGCYKLYPSMMAAREAQQSYIADGIMCRAVADGIATLGHPALYFESDIWGNAHAYCQALAADLDARGVVFIYGATDMRLRTGSDRVTAQLKGHVFDADHIVVAAGPHSSDVIAPLGLNLSMTSLRGFAVNFDKPDMDLPFAPLMDSQSRSAMTVYDDHLRLSGTVGAESAHPLLQRWCEIAPDIMRRLKPAKEIWSGLRPMPDVGRPYIGQTSMPGLWVNTGHGHMGWTLCAASGDLMARMILDGEIDERFVVIEA